MKIEYVNREEIQKPKKYSSKYKPLLEALDNLKDGGKAVKVDYEDENELNSIRTAVYEYNKKNGLKIRSRTDPKQNWIYFYKETDEE